MDHSDQNDAKRNDTQNGPEQPHNSQTSGSKSKDDRLLSSLQESIVTALVYKNDDNTKKIVKLIDLEWFEDPYRDIVFRALQQREEFHEAPGFAHVDDVFGPILCDPDHKLHNMYHRILRGMMQQSPDLNTEFLLANLYHFARRQNLKRAMFKVGTILSQSFDPDEYDKAEEIFAGVKSFRGLEALPVLSIKQLFERDYPPRLKILGDLITNQSRVMLVGPKGKGKTRLMLEMALSIAAGKSFLHWQGSGVPKRVLYIDGELGGLQFRDLYLAEALRRYDPFPDTILFLFHDDFPGGIPPLNTPAGRKLVEWAIDEYAPDAIIFDNIQCLLQRDEAHGAKSWSETLPMGRSLTARNIAQIWGDHTGHNEARNGDSDKKTWQMDSVGLLSKTEGTEDIVGVLQFTLDFNIKKRPANSDNWRDFQPVDITFTNNEWSFIPSKDNPKPERATKSEQTTKQPKEPPERAQDFHQRLLEVIKGVGTTPADDVWRNLGVDPVDYRHHLVVLGKANWKEACWIPGLLGEKQTERQEVQAQHRTFTRVKDQLVNAGWIGSREVDNDDFLVWTKRW